MEDVEILDKKRFLDSYHALKPEIESCQQFSGIECYLPRLTKEY